LGALDAAEALEALAADEDIEVRKAASRALNDIAGSGRARV
jgi:hypothetical protein